MRLGVVTTSYPRESGDPAGNFVAGFTRWLADAGADVEVVAAGPGQACVDGIGVTRVGGWGLFYAGGAPDALAGAQSPFERARAWARAVRFQADLTAVVATRAGAWDGVVSHWLVPSALAVEAVFSSQRVRRTTTSAARHLAIAHSSDVWLLRRHLAGRAAVRALARRADVVYAARHLVVERAPGRVVPMGIDLPPPITPIDRAAARRRWNLPPESPPDEPRGARRLCALFVGRLVPIKGLDLLLAALPVDMDLLVAGEGPSRRALEAAAASNPRVRFVGELRGDEKRGLLAAGDLLVIPSRTMPDGRSEGTPTVLMEALAAGLPVVATRSGGIADQLTDDENALLVEPSATPLRLALQRFLDDPSLLPRLRQRAARTAGNHGWNVVGPRLAGHLLRAAEPR